MKRQILTDQMCSVFDGMCARSTNPPTSLCVRRWLSARATLVWFFFRARKMNHAAPVTDVIGVSRLYLRASYCVDCCSCSTVLFPWQPLSFVKPRSSRMRCIKCSKHQQSLFFIFGRRPSIMWCRQLHTSYQNRHVNFLVAIVLIPAQSSNKMRFCIYCLRMSFFLSLCTSPERQTRNKSAVLFV